MTSSLNTTSPCSTHGSNYNYQEPMRPIASTTDFEKEISTQDKYISKECLKEILTNLDKSKLNFTNKCKTEIVLDFVNHIKSVSDKNKCVGAYLIDYLNKNEKQKEKEAEFALTVLTSEWIRKDIEYNQEASTVLEKLVEILLRGIHYGTDLSSDQDFWKLKEDVMLSRLISKFRSQHAIHKSTSLDYKNTSHRSFDQIDKLFNETTLDTTVASNTSQEYDYHKPDIFNVLMPINNNKEFNERLSPQDKYLSKRCLKDILRNESYILPCDSKKINKMKLEYIKNFVGRLTYHQSDKKKYGDAFLIRFLKKPKEQQLEEIDVAFATLISKWNKKNIQKFTSEDLPSYCEKEHAEAMIKEMASNALSCLKLSSILNHIPKLAATMDLQKSTEVFLRKINKIIISLNNLNQTTAASTVNLKNLSNQRVKPLEGFVAKLQKEDLPKLNERIDDLEHVSTHVIHGMNEEVQKLSDKTTCLENKTTLLENKTTRLEECFKDIYFISENLKNEIADKDTKIAQLASKVDACQQEILEVKAINKAQAETIQQQAQTIQEFRLHQMQMKETQTRQQDTLNKLLDMLQTEKVVAKKETK